MGKASAAIDIPAPPNEVWQLIGGFNSLPDWLSYIPKSELSEDGRVRQVADLKGETIWIYSRRFDQSCRHFRLARRNFTQHRPHQTAYPHGAKIVATSIKERNHAKNIRNSVAARCEAYACSR